MTVKDALGKALEVASGMAESIKIDWNSEAAVHPARIVGVSDNPQDLTAAISYVSHPKERAIENIANHTFNVLEASGTIPASGLDPAAKPAQKGGVTKT